MSEDKTQDTVEEEKVGPGAYIALLAALVFFSGIFYKIDGYKWLGALDFTTLAGAFGQISGKTFVGSGGIGARSGFLFALSLVPTVMLALGILEIVTYYGAIRAATRVLNPILRPLMGLPGSTSLAIVASLQSTDAGAALTRALKDRGELTEDEVSIFATFQMTADAALGNFLATGVVFFTLKNAAGDLVVPTTIGVCLGIILLGKVFAANVMRLLCLRRRKPSAAA